MSRGMIREGLILGVIGTVTVAVFFAVFDFLAARGTFYTVNVLGLALFRGLRDPTVLQTPLALDFTVIALYSVLHLAVSLVIGLVVAWLVTQFEGPPAQARLALLVVVAGFFVTIFGMGMVSEPIRPLLPWWSVVAANALAVVVAGAYVLGRHPGLLRKVMPAL